MSKPIGNKIIPFDSDFDVELSFTWNGNQAYANRLIIYDANTLSVVYDKKISSFIHSHTLPAKTLSNGKKWIYQFQVFDMEDIESELSDKMFFQTFKTPVFYFYELNEGQTINTASYEARIYYNQEDYESLQSYKFYIYDGTKNLLSESQTLYDSNNIKYIYKGLENHTVYYLKCHGLTANGIDVDTGYVSIYTDYQAPSAYSIMYAENDPFHGYIKYHTNIKVIQYNGNNIFNFQDGMIDLRNNSIYYDRGFVMEDDFTLDICGMYLNKCQTLLELRNTKYSLKLSSYTYFDNTTRYKIIVPNGLSNYVLYSRPVNIINNEIVCIRIKRIKDIYQLDVLLKNGPSFENSNIWFGQQMPSGSGGVLKKYDDWITSPNLFTYVTDINTINIYHSKEKPLDVNIDDIWIQKEE